MRNLKKVLAAALSASMVMAMSVPAMAADSDSVSGNKVGGITAPVISLNVEKVVVPADYKIVFNPDQLVVKTGESTTSTDQILSRNFGIVNQSSQDKIVSVNLAVEDLNKGEENEITFSVSANAASNAEEGEFALYLAAVPADTTPISLSANSVSANATPADLADVNMTKAVGKEMPLNAGDNTMQFYLKKAVYGSVSGNEIDLDTVSGNDVKDNLELKSLETNGKSVTAFTLTGSMNKNAEWGKIKEGIKITPTYTVKTALTSPTVESGTGALYVDPIPKFTTGIAVGTIQYTAGAGDDAVKSINDIIMVSAGGKEMSIYKALAGSWAAATESNGIITIDPKCISAFANALPNDTERDVTITFTNQNDETQTVTIKIKLR